MSPRVLAVLVAAWALVTWGGRIGLLTEPEGADPVTWLRIVGSLVVAALATWALWSGGGSWATWAYAGVTALVWLTSLASVWTTEHPLGFRLVHTVLAVGSLSLAAAVVTIGRRRGALRSRAARAGAPPR